ncbi:MAG TPA: thermonuclease family protein [Methylococcus sp.]|nr:thermonuclease family protein [Methylococcus sp.]
MFSRRLLLALTLTLSWPTLGTAEADFRHDPSGTARYPERLEHDSRSLPVAPGISAYRRVQRVIDGDTVWLADGERVRLLSINTPEIDGPYQTGEPGGAAAKRWLESRLSGSRVRLERDVEERDRYGRLLAHLFGEDGTHINRALVAAGLAVVDIHPPNLKYTDVLLAAQREAETHRRGIWNLPAYAPVAIASAGARCKNLRGGWVRVIGRPKSLDTKGRNLRLLFDNDLRVHISRDDLYLFPAPARYLNRQLEVRGWLSRHGSGCSIRVRHPSGLLLLGD